MATLLKFYRAAKHKFQKQNAHKNTSVFIEDNIIELFVFQCSFYCILPVKKQKIRQRRRQENHRCGSWGGADHVFICGVPSLTLDTHLPWASARALGHPRTAPEFRVSGLGFRV